MECAPLSLSLPLFLPLPLPVLLFLPFHLPGCTGALEEKYHTVLLEHSQQSQELSRLHAAAKHHHQYSSVHDESLGGDEEDSHTTDSFTRCLRSHLGRERGGGV